MAKTVKMELVGADRVKFVTVAKGLAAYKRTCRILYQNAEKIMSQSKPLVPVDTGALKSSGFVIVRDSGGVFNVELGYGGPAAPYAVFVHEDAAVYHKVGQAFFLSRPFSAGLAIIIKDLEAGGKK